MRPPIFTTSATTARSKGCCKRCWPISRQSLPNHDGKLRSSFSKHTNCRYAPLFANVPPDCVIAGAAGQSAGWACGASRRRAPAPARRGQNAPRQPCRTMPAYSAPAFLWGNCVCVRMLPRCLLGESASSAAAKRVACLESQCLTSPSAASRTATGQPHPR